MPQVNSSLLWSTSVDNDLCQILESGYTDFSDSELEEINEIDEIDEDDDIFKISDSAAMEKKSNKDRWLHMRISWRFHSVWS